MPALFWGLMLIVFYVYLGYPALIWLLSRGKMKVSRESEYLPQVTLVVAAHNEEPAMRGKMENVLSLEYPKKRLQCIVASDASVDGTNEIVRHYSDKGIELYAQREHRGKSAALNHVVDNMAKGEIIVFTDATSVFKGDALKNIVSYFSDEAVGAVTGRLLFKRAGSPDIAEGHGLYWKYEEFLKSAESDAGYLPFVAGPFYAIRRRLYTPVPETMPDDSVSPLGVYKQGFRVAYAKDALAYEKGAADAKGEFRIKTRGIIRELSSIFYFKKLLNPFGYFALSLVLVSHRLLRWATSGFLIGLFLVNTALVSQAVYAVIFGMQMIFYLLALAGISSRLKFRLTGLPFYFCLVNAAALYGILLFLGGKRQATWKPVR